MAGTVRVLVADTLLTLSRDGTRAEASLQEYVNSSGGYSHRLLDARTAGDGALFLLIHTRGASRPDSPDGRCGAGEETNVTWLQVDSALRVVKGQTVLPASCLRAHEPVAPDPAKRVIRYDPSSEFAGLEAVAATEVSRGGAETRREQQQIGLTQSHRDTGERHRSFILFSVSV